MNALSANKKFRIAFAGWWLFWMQVQIYILMKYQVTGMPAFTDAVISNLLLAGACLLVSNNMRFYLPGKERYWYLLAISLGISAMWLLISRVVLWVFLKNNSAYLTMISNSSDLRFMIAFLIIGCMTVISLLWYTQQEQKEISSRKADAERLSKEAELNKLRQQLQPHFLFNSLNSISALTGTQPEKARHMIEQLSDFLRGTLRKDEQQWNTLSEELQYLQLYLDIEKVRFGHRLQTNIEKDDENLQMKLPSMLLQPVVENAIKFGLYDTVGEVCISIITKNKNGNLEVTVQNPFDVETAQPLQGTGFGLASIKRRLFLLFARHDLLQTKTENNFFITTVTIPQNV